VYRAAFRRLAVLVVLSSGIIVATSVVFGLLAGAPLDHAVAIGFYVVGSFLLVAGFFVGNRGPTRVASETPGAGWMPFPMFGNRKMRWATREEQQETINQSAVFITLGAILVLLGIAVDGRHRVL
jgi:hypothetical protein